jgi:hypothetical protein
MSKALLPPEADELPGTLLDLGVPYQDVSDLLAVRGRLARDRGLRAAFEAAVGALVDEMGAVRRAAGHTADLPETTDTTGRLLPVLVFVAAAPWARAYHEARAVPPDVSRRTLADLGRQMAVHRRRHGSGGLLNPSWLHRHFRGELYQLGRLQFQRSTLSLDEAAVVNGGGTGRGCLELHVPDFSGPLTPPACDRSLAWARDFFPRHFPEESYHTVCISSWLLDPQLRTYLAENSHIIQFQRRFQPLTPVGAPKDDEPIGFVFGNPHLPLDRLPRDTALQRALADHLRAGGHWYGGNGWSTL